MSDTPRTDGCLTEILDAYGFVHQGNCPQRWVNHARELERELNAANTEIEEKRKDVVWLATEKAKLENYVTELENRLRALWDKYDGDRKHYMERIQRLVMAGDALLSHSHCTNYHEKVAEWNEAKRIKLRQNNKQKIKDKKELL